MKIAVTGARGLMGRAITALLKVRGYSDIIAIDRVPSPRAEPPGCMIADLRHPDVTRCVIAGCDAVIHLAGRRGTVGVQRGPVAADMMFDNLAIDYSVFSAMRRLKITRGVYASTVSVYPEPVDPVDGDPNWDHAYDYREEDGGRFAPAESVRYTAWEKLTAERMLEAMNEESPHQISIVRMVNTFGPWDDFGEKALVVPALIKRALRKEDPFVVWGDGTTVRDLLYVEDAARGILAAFEHGRGARPYNIGSGTGHTVLSIVNAVLEACEFNPVDVKWDSSKPSGAPRKVVDIRRAYDELNWLPSVHLPEGIRRTVAWFQCRREKP